MKVAMAAVVLLCSACASPLAPTQTINTPCEIPTGPLTFRVAMMGHITNTPLAGLPAYLRATGCTRREAITNSEGIAEWQIPAGVYTVEFRNTAFFVDAEVSRSVEWLVSFPE